MMTMSEVKTIKWSRSTFAHQHIHKSFGRLVNMKIWEAPQHAHPTQFSFTHYRYDYHTKDALVISIMLSSPVIRNVTTTEIIQFPRRNRTMMTYWGRLLVYVYHTVMLCPCSSESKFDSAFSNSETTSSTTFSGKYLAGSSSSLIM